MMMYTILGATGNVGRKIADMLIKKGEKVRLIARSADRVRPIVGKQAQAFAGDAMDTEFLVKAFTGADAVFTMLPSNIKAENGLAYADKIGVSIARALTLAKVKYVVNLSSVGAELPEGTGPIVGLHRQEERLNKINGLNVLHLRAASFMENQLMSINLIRSRGINGSAIRGDIKFPMIATKDIAAFAAERLVKCDFTGSSIRYLLGQRDLSMIDATEIIGRKINNPALVYVMFPFDETEKWLMSSGLSPNMSRLYVEMTKAMNDNLIAAKRTSENSTPTSFEVFCDEVFVPAFMPAKAA
jgi:uncharacterized protein YbjT (DUF2867 family)